MVPPKILLSDLVSVDTVAAISSYSVILLLIRPISSYLLDGIRYRISESEDNFSP